MSPRSWNILIGDRDFSPTFVGHLRRLAKEWETGEDHFWSWQEIVASSKRPEVQLYYAAQDPSHEVMAEAAKGDWEGFLLAEIGPFSTELLYLHVARHGRRSGLGRALLTRLIADLKDTPNQEALFLEVRAGNTAAQALYRDLKMIEVGRRPKYYANGDDALVFKLDLTAGPE